MPPSLARELGIPAVVGCDEATSLLKTGDELTVSCAEGAVGRVYSGILPVTRARTDLGQLARPQVHLMVKVGNPDWAFQIAQLPTEGVGLAHMEFIVAEHIQAHPMALVHPEKIDDPASAARRLRTTRRWPSTWWNWA